MSMGMGHSQRMEPRQEQRMEMSYRQQMLIRQGQQLNLRLDLIDAVHGIHYRPGELECPNCFHRLSALEIVKGFNTDPTDYTTSCPICTRRFPAKLIARSASGTAEMPFYCASQTLAQLRDLTTVSGDELQNRHQAVYHSALFHFGGIRLAFRQIGFDFPGDVIADWQDKVTSFLGKVPDKLIAQYVEQPVKVVSKLRRSKSIPAYSPKAALAETVES